MYVYLKKSVYNIVQYSIELYIFVQVQVQVSGVKRQTCNLKMAAVHKIARFISRTKYLNNNSYYANENLRSFCTMVQQPQKTQSLVKIGLLGAVTGVALGAGYAYHKINKTRENIALEGTQAEVTLLKYKPSVTPSRKVFRRLCREKFYHLQHLISNIFLF